MTRSAPMKALAFVVFMLAVAGAVYGVSQFAGDDVSDSIREARERIDRRLFGDVLDLRSAHAVLNASPGHEVTYVIEVKNTGTRTADIVVELDGPIKASSGPVSIRENSTMGLFLTSRVPADAAPGEQPVTLRVLREGDVIQQEDSIATLRVLEPADGFAPGDAAQIAYTVRLTATGKAHRTSDPALFGIPFPRTDDYRAVREFGIVASNRSAALPVGVIEGIVGMQVNESRTLSFGSDKGFGPAVPTETRPRVETLPREHQQPNRPPTLRISEFESATGRSVENFTVGDRVELRDPAGAFPYRIHRITPSIVEVRWDFEVGDRITFFGPWTNGSEVRAIDNETITFFTTPNSEPGKAITLNPFWPQMSTLVEVNETTFTVQHNPDIGWKYTESRPPGGAREAVITGLTPTEVQIGYPSANPLAGDDLTYDVRILQHFRPQAAP